MTWIYVGITEKPVYFGRIIFFMACRAIPMSLALLHRQTQYVIHMYVRKLHNSRALSIMGDA